MKNIRPLFSPETIAVVGASEKTGAGSFVIENLKHLGFKGKIIPVNPRYKTIHQLTCYPSLLDIPVEEKIDSVAILLSRNQVIPILEEAGKRGIKSAWAFASGFAETGLEGESLQEELREVCEKYNILLCGPNCVGLINLYKNVAMFSAPISPTLKKGNVGLVSQSGSVLLAIANSNRGLKFSTLISSGNEAVLDLSDYFSYLLEDEHTEVIIAFIETIRRPDEFIRCCKRAIELEKPIIVVKVGRSQIAQKFAMTHTGAITGTDEVYNTLFKKFGVIRVDDLNQLLETAELFSQYRKVSIKGNRIGAITLSGGEIGLIGDLSEGLSFSFPSLSEKAQNELKKRLPPFTPIGNPLDAWGSGDLERSYQECLEVLAKEENLDLIIISQDAPPGMAEKQIQQYTEVARAAVRISTLNKPVIAISHISGGIDQNLKEIMEKGNIPFLQGTKEGLAAINHLINYKNFLKNYKEKKEERVGRSPNNISELTKKFYGNRRLLRDSECKEILRAYEIPIIKEVVAHSLEEALNAANEISYPIVLKGLSREFPHKTEAGLVKLGIRNEKELIESFNQILELLQNISTKENIEGILVQKMLPSSSIEAFLGISKDPSFGPVIVFGLGGIWIELLKDIVMRLPPIDSEEAYKMISEIKGKAIFEGYRGMPKADIHSLIHIILQISQMADDLKDIIFSLDLNPLMILPEGEGVWVVDALMEVG